MPGPQAVDERYEVELYCARCSRTTAHLVTPGTGGLSRVLCVRCGRAVAVDTLHFMEQYVDSVVRRALAKPFEMTTEFTRHPREFITRFPGRVLTKPFRVAAELRATMDIIRPRPRHARRTVPVLPAPGELPPAERRCQVLLSAPLLWAHTADEILDAARDLGYDGVEMWAYQLLRDGTDAVLLGERREAGGWCSPCTRSRGTSTPPRTWSRSARRRSRRCTRALMQPHGWVPAWW